jgi:histidinol-phosphatase (PHP family)
MKTQLINHHIHSTGSDGKESPEKIVKLAIKTGLDFICFTDHNYRSYTGEFSWGEDFFSKEYLKSIKKLREIYKDRIEISFGIEIDWVDEAKKIIMAQINKHKFDYVLGSVHILKAPNGDFFGVNFFEENFQKKVEQYGIEWIIKEYFNQIRLLAKSKVSDCIGHLDVIKTFNKENKYFDEDSDLYKGEILKALDEIKRQDLCIEINTSGLVYLCEEIFPKEWILKEAKKRGIPVTVGSDFHGKVYGRSSDISLDNHIRESYKLLKKIGYTSIVKFKNRKRIKVPI